MMLVFKRSLVVLFAILSLLLSSALAKEVTFVYRPPAEIEVSKVSLRGQFNNWGETRMELQADGSWSVTIELEPGEYQYKFFINGEWPGDMENWRDLGPVDPTADGYINDGYDGQNAIRIVEDEPVAMAGEVPALDLARIKHDPLDPAYRSIADDKLVLRVQTLRDQVQSIKLLSDGAELPLLKQLWWGNREVWRVSLPANATSYSFEIQGADGSSAILDNAGTPFVFDGTESFPELDWVGEQVFYQIFPERFNNGNPYNDSFAVADDEANFNTFTEPYGGGAQLSGWTDPPGPSLCCHQYFGGDLAGIIEKLDYLQGLGVTALYLNPIFQSGSAHGYDTSDYLKVSPKFGTEKTLRNLIDLAHARGMKIILDYVPNHTGVGFWAFQDVVEKGPDSDYWDWYQIKKWPFEAGDPSAYEAWWGIGSLPQLNMLNAETKQYMLEVARYWVEFGIDGWRVDVPGDVLDAHNFFKDMRRVVKEANPEAFIVGEIWQLAPEWLQGDEFDSLMNYAIGRDILLRYAKGGDTPFATGGRALADMNRYYAQYGENVAAMGFNLIGSHDTARILTDLGGGIWGETPEPEAVERLKLASTLLYTLPGTPSTFQGDECGFLGEKEREGTQDLHRYPIQWEQCSAELQAHYRDLAALREAYPALRSATYRGFAGGDNLLAYYRGEPNSEGEVLILANNGLADLNVKMPMGEWRRTDRGGLLRDGKEVTVPALTVKLFVRK